MKIGDAVAVLTSLSDLPSDLIKIATIKRVSNFFTETDCGRMFTTADGKGVAPNEFIVPAKRKHRAEMHRRLQSGNGQQPH